MSFAAVAWAFKQEGLSCQAKFILVALADMVDMAGKCWPSQSFLAKRCCLPRESINRRLRELEKAGLLRAEQRVGDKGKQSNVYFLLCDEASHLDVTQDHTPCDEASQTHVTRRHIEPISIEPIKESPPIVPPRGTAHTAFENWWKSYPAKIGKGAAEKAWSRAVKLAAPEELAAGVARYVANKPADREWCHPATWLNQHRWLDDYGEPSIAPRILPKGPPPKLEQANGNGHDWLSEQGALRGHSEEPAGPELFRSYRH